MKCEATLTECQGVAVCEVCDWNENGSDGPHGEIRTYLGEEGTRKVTTVAAADLCPQCDRPSFEVRFDDEFQFLVCCDPVACEEPTYLGYDPADHDVNPSEWQCDHGVWCNAEATTACVLCSGKRDEFASYRKADGEGRFVKPYAELPATVRGSFGIGQVRAVITSGETETRQWTDAPCEGDWAGDEDTPVYCQPKAKSGDVVPRWWLETERGVTPRKNVAPSWDEAIRQAVAAERAYLDSEALPDVAIVRGLVMAASSRKRGDVDVQAWRASAKHRSEYVSTFNMDDHIPAR